jgi:hypothetical protein
VLVFKRAVAEGVGNDGVGLVAEGETTGEDLLYSLLKCLLTITHHITFSLADHALKRPTATAES